jgi:molecular chaperone DnaK
VVVDAEPALSAARGAAELAADLQEADLPQEPADTVADPPSPTATVGRRTTTRLAAGAGRPPARSGTRPPTPATGQPGRRRAARVGVVLSAFVVLVLGVAVAVSATWSGSPVGDAAADVVPPAQADAPESSPEVAGTVGGGLSPAAAQGGTDGQDSADDGTSSGAGTADHPATAGHRGTADHPSTASTSASRSTAAGRAPTAGASSAAAPQPGRPVTVSDPGPTSAAPVAEPVGSTSVPPAVDPAPDSQPPVDPAPISEPPADPSPTSEPPADPPAASDPPADPPPAETSAPEPPPATDVPPPAETGAA